MGLLTSLGSFFGSSGFANTANDAIRKVGGLDDLNGKERIDKFIEVLKVTQQQSPARRMIAFVVAGIWALLVVCWLLMIGLNQFAAAMAIKEFMKETVTEPFNYIIAFYFVSAILSGIKK